MVIILKSDFFSSELSCCDHNYYLYLEKVKLQLRLLKVFSDTERLLSRLHLNTGLKLKGWSTLLQRCTKYLQTKTTALRIFSLNIQTYFYSLRYSQIERAWQYAAKPFSTHLAAPVLKFTSMCFGCWGNFGSIAKLKIKNLYLLLRPKSRNYAIQIFILFGKISKRHYAWLVALVNLVRIVLMPFSLN